MNHVLTLMGASSKASKRNDSERRGGEKRNLYGKAEKNSELVNDVVVPVNKSRHLSILESFQL